MCHNPNALLDELKNIPSVDSLLKQSEIAQRNTQWGADIAVFAVRQALAAVRAEARDNGTQAERNAIVGMVCKIIDRLTGSPFRRVVNATGIIIHTNLGRAPFGEGILQEVLPVLRGYVNLEFDLETGKRGERSKLVEEQLCFLTGAESAVVVNNNAAAVMLSLATLSGRKQAVVSRGELIEIGGSFRLPDIMAASGAIMVEAGTTNRTRLSDYERAIGQETAVLFKAHKSNYSIEGFTEEVAVKDLAALAHRHNLHCIYDLGSGLLRAIPGIGVENEPTAAEAVSAGADIVLFSCDKLLGGPQAGVIVGNAGLVHRIAKAPLMRTVRVDKVTMALVSAVLSRHIDSANRLREIPAFDMLYSGRERLLERARGLSAMLAEAGIPNSVVESPGRTGGGSLPSATFPGYAVKLYLLSRNAAAGLHARLLQASVPVLGILREGELLFDVLALLPGDEEDILAALRDTA